MTGLIIGGVLWLAVIAFGIALARAAGDADRAMEKFYDEWKRGGGGQTWAVLLVVLALGGCVAEPTDWECGGCVAFRPAENPLGHQTATYYPAWWAEVEACVGARRPIDRVRWWYLPADSGDVLNVAGRAAWGAYDRSDNEIWLVELALTYEPIVKHEMIHALIDSPGHPDVFDRCDPGTI